MEIVIGDKYRHFKGHIYKVLCLAKDSEDLSIKVVYQNIENEDIWVRPISEFQGKVDKNKYPNVQQEYRFEHLDD